MQITIPPLNAGEHHAGILFANDVPVHHVIVLPGDLAPSTWKKAKAWAEKLGGELPTRREQALLFANAPEQFKEQAYWSGTQHAAYPDFAWCQYFFYGDQLSHLILSKLRARAVRRVAI